VYLNTLQLGNGIGIFAILGQERCPPRAGTRGCLNGEDGRRRSGTSRILKPAISGLSTIFRLSYERRVQRDGKEFERCTRLRSQLSRSDQILLDKRSTRHAVAAVSAPCIDSRCCLMCCVLSQSGDRNSDVCCRQHRVDDLHCATPEWQLGSYADGYIYWPATRIGVSSTCQVGELRFTSAPRSQCRPGYFESRWSADQGADLVLIGGRVPITIKSGTATRPDRYLRREFRKLHFRLTNSACHGIDERGGTVRFIENP
jgi:hypothetical protein